MQGSSRSPSGRAVSIAWQALTGASGKLVLTKTPASLNTPKPQRLALSSMLLRYHATSVMTRTTAYGTVAKINAVERSTASPTRKKKIKRTILPSHSVRLGMALLGTLTADSSRSCAARLTGLVILSSTTPLIQKPARKYVPQIRSVRVPLFTSRHPNVTISGRVSLRDLQMPRRKVTGSLSVSSQSAEFWEPARISAVDAWSHPTSRVCNLSSMVMVQSSSTSFPLLVATFATTLTYSWLSLFFATS